MQGKALGGILLAGISLANMIPSAQPHNLFSFDTLVSEVNTIVEDLRWLHLELSLRNRCNEILFQDVASVEELLTLAFIDLREKLGVLEFSVYLRDKQQFRQSFQELEASVFWKHDHMPWIDSMNRWLLRSGSESTAPTAEVNHYTINGEAITSIAMPVLFNREYIAVLLVVAHSSGIVPRMRKLLAGVAGSLSLSIDYVRNRSAHRLPAGIAAPSLDEVLDSGMSEHSFDSVFQTLLLDPELRIVALNASLRKETGFSLDALQDRTILETLIPESERVHVETGLRESATGDFSTQSLLFFHIKTNRSASIPYAWHVRSFERSDGVHLLLAGARIPKEQFEAMTAHHPSPTTTPSMEARLSKHYRFLMKYVPFPVIHLDQDTDTIRNANPSFSELIGTRNWEGAPLSDYATLEVHGEGDPRPCTLYVLSPNGITLSFRGIITTLNIFGKVIREIKLDPLE